MASKESPVAGFISVSREMTGKRGSVASVGGKCGVFFLVIFWVKSHAKVSSSFLLTVEV